LILRPSSSTRALCGILKRLSARETDIAGEGVVQVLPNGFDSLRPPGG
jgi:hypothetical protein